MGLSVWLVEGWVIRPVILATVAVGLTVVTVIVPTKETVEAQRATE